MPRAYPRAPAERRDSLIFPLPHSSGSALTDRESACKRTAQKGFSMLPPDVASAAVRLNELIRRLAPGGCKILSRGAECLCPLCDLDRILGAVAPAASAADCNPATPAVNIGGSSPPRATN